MKKKAIMMVALLVLLVVAATFAYQRLSENFAQKNLHIYEESKLATEDSQAPAPQGQTAQQEPDAPVKAPDFTVENAAGEEVSLSSFEGTPLVLNFWASWCGPCRAEMPYFNELAEEYKGKVNFMMVNVDETPEKAEGYLEKEGYTLVGLYDLKGEASMLYGINSIPQTFFIDAGGNVAAAASGSISKELLQEGISLIMENANN